MLTVVFMAIAGFYALRCVRSVDGGSPTRADRVSAGMHVVMSVGMVPMAWWWGMNLPVIPQLVVFGLGALWFLTLAVSGSTPRGCAMHARRGMRFYDVHHFVLMAAMVWMVAAMSLPVLVAPASAAAPAAGMPAMAMDHGHVDGMTQMEHSMDHAMLKEATAAAGEVHAAHAGGPAGVAAVSVALAAYFLLLIPWWLFELVGARRTPAGLLRWLPRDASLSSRAPARAVALEAGVHALKCGGMGVMLLAML